MGGVRRKNKTKKPTKQNKKPKQTNEQRKNPQKQKQTNKKNKPAKEGRNYLTFWNILFTFEICITYRSIAKITY